MFSESGIGPYTILMFKCIPTIHALLRSEPSPRGLTVSGTLGTEGIEYYIQLAGYGGAKMHVNHIMLTLK